MVQCWILFRKDNKPSNFKFGSEIAFFTNADRSTKCSDVFVIEHMELRREVFFSKGFGGKSKKKTKTIFIILKVLPNCNAKII